MACDIILLAIVRLQTQHQDSFIAVSGDSPSQASVMFSQQQTMDHQGPELLNRKKQPFRLKDKELVRSVQKELKVRQRGNKEAYRRKLEGSRTMQRKCGLV